MYKVLRIVCCIISALLVAGCVFIFIYTDSLWSIAAIVGAVAFFLLTLLFKNLQEDKEKKAEPKTGFLAPDNEEQNKED